MKKVKVIKKYNDKFTKATHFEGEDLNLTNDRADELVSLGRVVIVDDEGNEVKETSEAKDITSENIKQDKSPKQTKEEKAAAKVETK